MINPPNRFPRGLGRAISTAALCGTALGLWVAAVTRLFIGDFGQAVLCLMAGFAPAFIAWEIKCGQQLQAERNDAYNYEQGFHIHSARADEAERRLNEALDLLRSAKCIADRKGRDTAWARFGASIARLGISGVTARTYRVLPDDEVDGPGEEDGPWSPGWNERSSPPGKIEAATPTPPGRDNIPPCHSRRALHYMRTPQDVQQFALQAIVHILKWYDAGAGSGSHLAETLGLPPHYSLRGIANILMCARQSKEVQKALGELAT